MDYKNEVFRDSVLAVMELQRDLLFHRIPEGKTKEYVDIYNITPKLVIIMVGNNPASQIYVRNKIKSATYCGINAELIKLEENITNEELIDIVEKLNIDNSVHGIIVQLPLPKHMNEAMIINTVKAEKDVDGFGIINKGKLFSGIKCLVSATPSGIMKLFEEYNIDLTGKNAVVIGRSNIVGKPMSMLLLNANATVTITHSKTKNLSEITKNADIIVAAVGKANFVTSDMVKEGAIIIDVGINRIDDKIYGDVDFENVKEKASYITPVPGGVGPLTIVSLLENTLKAYEEIVKK